MRYQQLPQNIIFFGVESPADFVMVSQGDIRYTEIVPLMADFNAQIEKIKTILTFKHLLSSGEFSIKNNILYFKKFPMPDEVSKYFFSKNYNEEQTKVICNLWVSLFTRQELTVSVHTFEQAVGERSIRPLTKDGTVLAYTSYGFDPELQKVLKEAGMVVVRMNGNVFEGDLDTQMEIAFPGKGKVLTKELIKSLRAIEKAALDWDNVLKLQSLHASLNLSMETLKVFVTNLHVLSGLKLEGLADSLTFLTNFWSPKKLLEKLLEEQEGKNQSTRMGMVMTTYNNFKDKEYLMKNIKHAPKCATFDDIDKWIKKMNRKAMLDNVFHKFPPKLLPWLYVMDVVRNGKAKYFPTLEEINVAETEGRELSPTVYDFRIFRTIEELSDAGIELNHCLGSIDEGGEGNYTVRDAKNGKGVFAGVYKEGKLHMSCFWQLSNNNAKVHQFYGKGNTNPADKPWLVKTFIEPFTQFMNKALQVDKDDLGKFKLPEDLYWKGLMEMLLVSLGYSKNPEETGNYVRCDGVFVTAQTYRNIVNVAKCFRQYVTQQIEAPVILDKPYYLILQILREQLYGHAQANFNKDSLIFGIQTVFPEFAERLQLPEGASVATPASMMSSISGASPLPTPSPYDFTKALVGFRNLFLPSPESLMEPVAHYTEVENDWDKQVKGEV